MFYTICNTLGESQDTFLKSVVLALVDKERTNIGFFLSLVTWHRRPPRNPSCLEKGS